MINENAVISFEEFKEVKEFLLSQGFGEMTKSGLARLFAKFSNLSINGLYIHGNPKPIVAFFKKDFAKYSLVVEIVTSGPKNFSKELIRMFVMSRKKIYRVEHLKKSKPADLIRKIQAVIDENFERPKCPYCGEICDLNTTSGFICEKTNSHDNRKIVTINLLTKAALKDKRKFAKKNSGRSFRQNYKRVVVYK